MLNLRLGTAEDGTRLLALQAQFYREDEITYGPHVAEALVALLAGHAPGLACVAESGPDGVVGYVVVTFGYSLELGGRDAMIDELYVTPNLRRRGVGKALLQRALTLATEAGAKAIQLEVAAPDEQKLRLYRAFGFAPRPYPLMTRHLPGHTSTAAPATPR